MKKLILCSIIIFWAQLNAELKIKKLKAFVPHCGESITSIACSPKGKFLASASGRVVKLWYLNSLKKQPRRKKEFYASIEEIHQTLKNASSISKLLRFKLENLFDCLQVSKLISPTALQKFKKNLNSSEQANNLFKLQALLREIKNELDGFKVLCAYPDKIQVKSVAFSPKGKLLAVGLNNGVVEIWDVKKGCRKNSIRLRKNKKVDAVAFSSDRGKLAIAYSDNNTGFSHIVLWYRRYDFLENIYHCSKTSCIISLSFNPRLNDACLAAVFSNNDKDEILLLEKNKKSKRHKGKWEEKIIYQEEDHDRNPLAGAKFVDKDQLCISFCDKKIIFFDVKKNGLKEVAADDIETVSDIALISRSNKFVLATSLYNKIVLWEVSGESLKVSVKTRRLCLSFNELTI